MTKIHGNVERTTLFEAAEKYNKVAPKGEFFLIVEGKPEDETEEITLQDAIDIAKNLIDDGLSKNEAAKEAAKQTGFKKSDYYKSLI